jgi:hypothetical protein
MATAVIRVLLFAEAISLMWLLVLSVYFSYASAAEIQVKCFVAVGFEQNTWTYTALLEIWKEGNMVQFEIISRNYSGWTEDYVRNYTSITSVSDEVSTRQLPILSQYNHWIALDWFNMIQYDYNYMVRFIVISDPVYA